MKYHMAAIVINSESGTNDHTAKLSEINSEFHKSEDQKTEYYRNTPESCKLMAEAILNSDA